MRGVLAVVLLSALGCGRIGFRPLADNPADAAVPGDGATTDGPLVDPGPPSGAICQVNRIPIAAAAASTDLAITATAEGYAAVWLDTQAVTASQAMRIDTNHHALDIAALPYLTDSLLDGLTDTGQALMIAATTDIAQDVFGVTLGDFMAPSTTQRTPSLGGRDPFTGDAAAARRVLVSASGGTINLDLVNVDGTLGLHTDQIYGTPKLDLACATGPGHGHCVWSEQNNDPAQSRCLVVEIDTTALKLGTSDGEGSLANDCEHPRLASGRGADDAKLVVWTTHAGALYARYQGPPADTEGMIAASGAAPKVQFDDQRFWIAWLDGQNGLQLTTYGDHGVTTSFPLPGWLPRGPEAFELVRRDSAAGPELVLAIVQASELDLLTLCKTPIAAR